jgi:hypothetical protein
MKAREEGFKMKKFIIKSNYKYEIKAKNEQEAIAKFLDTIENELCAQNESITTVFVDSLYID